MRRILSEKNLHILLEAGIFLKLAISIVEIAAGVFLMFGGYHALNSIVLSLAGSEIREDPADPFWALAMRTVRNITLYPESFWVFILLSHGIIKVGLSVGLWLKKYWAYPVTAAVFALFAVYQIYQMAYMFSMLLLLVTLFDILLIALIIHDYRRHQRLSAAHRS